MSSEGSARAAAGAAAGDAGGGDAVAPSRVHHPTSFKLRFAEHRELGRSYVSLVKPLGLPATVTNKFYGRERAEPVSEPQVEAALQRIEDMFAHGPRDKYHSPLTSSHEYGWWWEQSSRMAAVSFADRRLHHHIRDSGWMKARVLVLAADNKLKQR